MEINDYLLSIIGLILAVLVILLYSLFTFNFIILLISYLIALGFSIFGIVKSNSKKIPIIITIIIILIPIIIYVLSLMNRVY